MSDVRYILGIQGSQVEEKAPNRKKRKFEVTSDTKVLKKKKTGLAREVAALALHNSHLAPLSPEPTVLAEKPKLNRAARRWLMCPIKSTANPKFEVKHWAKVTEKPGDYAFAKYSKKVPMARYTEQEYQQFFLKNAEQWTRQETDYLLDECERFDCKFVVVHDRWNYNGGKGPVRTIEDIKARFYFIRETLERIHPALRNKEVDGTVAPYNKEQEVLRKKQIEVLTTRPPSMQKEEASLLSRYNSLMAAFKERRTESKKIMKMAQNSLSTKKKKVKPPMPKDFMAKMSRYSVALHSAMQELGITKPNPADAAASQKYNDIRTDLVVLFELQRLQACAMYELQVLTGHQALLSNTDIPIVQLDSLQPPPSEFSLLPIDASSQLEAFDASLPLIQDDLSYELSDEDEVVVGSSNTASHRKQRAVKQNLRRRPAYSDDEDDDEESMDFGSTSESDVFDNSDEDS